VYAKLTETSAAYRAIVVKSDGGEIQLNPPNRYWDAGNEDLLQETRDAAKAVHLAWAEGEITTEDLAREVIRLVAQDVAAGTVPWDVADYSELHDYVDANEYTLEVIGLLSPDDEGSRPAATGPTSEVQTRVSEMLSGSSRSPMTPGYGEWRAIVDSYRTHQHGLLRER
jgi:hypothetical protein